MRVRLSYYAEVQVQADTLEQAKAEALREAPRVMDRDDGCWGEEPRVVEFLEVDDEDHEDSSDYRGMGWVGGDGRS